jgi:hypothetical protein
MVGSIVLAGLSMLLLAGSVSAAAGRGTSETDSQLRARAAKRGVSVSLRLPAGPWQPEQVIEGTVVLNNHNDRRAYYFDIGCTDIKVPVRLPTSPTQGREWTGDLATFKQLALGYRLDRGPIIGYFVIPGAPEACAEPPLEHLNPGERRAYPITYRVPERGFGEQFLDVTASFGFEGFRPNIYGWQDDSPLPISASLQIDVAERPLRPLMGPARAIDRLLENEHAQRLVRRYLPGDTTRVQMSLYKKTRGPWVWWVWLRTDSRFRLVYDVNAHTGEVSES